MQEIAEKDSFVLFRTSGGAEVRGNVLHLSRHRIVFETYQLQAALQVSEVLNEFQIALGDRISYSGRAVLVSLINSGVATIGEASLEDAWTGLDFAGGLNGSDQVRGAYQTFFEQWQKTYKIQPEFKLIVADLQTYLTDLRLWLEQIELGIRASPSADRIQLERKIVQEVVGPVLPTLTHFFDKFEAIAVTIEPELRPAHQVYLRRQIHASLLSSPFVYRTFTKPLGYPGDYEMVNMIMGDPYEGSTLFGKVINSWFILQPPAEAHRNRIEHLGQKLIDETMRAHAAGQRLHVFNLGCGPAWEVQNFLREHTISDQVDFVLADFNDETLEHSRSTLSRLKTQQQRKTSLHFIKKSVQQLLKEAGKSVERSSANQYGLIYCAGLFDYLPDNICRRLLSVLYGWLSPGGLLLITNVDLYNPSRQTMEYVLEWNLVYRDRKQLEALSPAGPEDSCVVSDLTGSNIYLEVRKPRS